MSPLLQLIEIHYSLLVRLEYNSTPLTGTNLNRSHRLLDSFLLVLHSFHCPVVWIGSQKKNFYVKRLGRSWQNLREFVKIAPLDGYATRIDWLQFSAKPRTWHFWLTVWCRWLHKTRQIITRHWESSSYLWNMKEFPTIFVGAWVVGGRGKKGVNILCVTFRCCENGQIGTSSDTPGRRANRTSFVSNQNRQCFPPDLVTPN